MTQKEVGLKEGYAMLKFVNVYFDFKYQRNV